MSAEERKAFDIWFDKNADEIYDIEKMAKIYCQQDCDILMNCLLQFREECINLTQV